MNGQGVEAQFVQVGGRRVFVRHAGNGPALVLLHQSPQSSAALLPWFERFADRYAVFAPDTPGFGFSDPLPLAQPTIPDLAQALSDGLVALGLGRVLIWGVHTGAVIAARLAQDYPDQVAALVCDGLALFNADERQPLLDGYLEPIEPHWDGTHLLWLWARVREQTMFFPWHADSAAARIPYPPSSTDRIHADVMDLLRAGDGYRSGYRAPLMYESGAAGARQLTVPARLLYRETDVLRPHLARLGDLPPGVLAEAVADPEAMARCMDAFFAEHRARAADVSARTAIGAAEAPTRGRIATACGALGWHARPRRAALAELSIADIGCPAQPPADVESGASSWALDWPGHGASDAWAESDVPMPVLAQAVHEALDALGVGALALRASGGGCALAAELAARLGPRCVRLTLHDPLPLDAEETTQFLACLPSLQPQSSGAHLLEAWNWARGARLFWRWLPPDAASAIRTAAPPPRAVHEQVVEMLQAGPLHAALWRSALAVDLPARLGELRCEVNGTAAPHAESQRLLQRELAKRPASVPGTS